MSAKREPWSGTAKVDRTRAASRPRPSRTLTPHDPIQEPNGRTLWFGAGLDPDGEQVWFRIDEDAIGRMPEKTPAARGDRLIDALIRLDHAGPPARARARPTMPAAQWAAQATGRAGSRRLWPVVLWQTRRPSQPTR